MAETFYPIVGRDSSLPVYLTGVCRQEQQSHIVRPAGLGSFQLLYGSKGSGVLRMGNDSFSVNTGAGFFLFPETAHEYFPARGIWETNWITFSGGAAREIVTALGVSDNGPITLSDPAFFAAGLNDLLRTARTATPESGARCSAILYSILTELGFSAHAKANPRTAAALERLQPVITLIDRSFSAPLTLDDLADAAEVSPQYLCRLFQAALGMRPFAYLTLRRVQHAKNLLTETDLPVGDIAADSGFGSSNYFCATFRRTERISPEEFRRRHHSR